MVRSPVGRRLRAALAPGLRVGLLVGLPLGLLPAAGDARAQEDGVYGRLDGDVLLVGEAGCAVADGGPSLLAGARALYLSTAGAYARYIEGFDRASLATDRSIAVGIEMRPLFLARFAQDWERGPAHLDLLLDSFAIDVGGFMWSPPGGALRTIPGLEVAAGFEVPFLPEATGPRLGAMGALRVSHGDTGAPGGEHLDARASAVFITLSWHQIQDAGIVDAGDALVR